MKTTDEKISKEGALAEKSNSGANTTTYATIETYPGSRVPMKSNRFRKLGISGIIT
jgi:hypothetical protein